MSSLYLEKFPVISETGNEYLATVENVRNLERTVEITIYKPRTKKGIFGRSKIICEPVGGSCYQEDGGWNYDYKAMAINEIIRYENSVKNQVKHEDNRKEGVKQFEDWDGKE